MRKLVKDNEKELIMKLTLDLAHDENEKLREASVKLLNELAPDMGRDLCEAFIVPEMNCQRLDVKPLVRIAVAKNLTNLSNCVSADCFIRKVFPMYRDLAAD